MASHRLSSFELELRAHRRRFLHWMIATPIVACGQGGEKLDTNAAASEKGEDAGGQGDAGETDGAVTHVDPDAGEDAARACRVTSSDAKGPYYEPGAPSRVVLASPNEAGVRLALEGTLFGPGCRTPLGGYILDVWQADAQGNYYEPDEGPYRLRGKVTTDDAGHYRFETILPGRYGDASGIRPAHIHLSIHTPMGNTLLTTQLYFEGDPYLGEADYCTRDGTCNSSDGDRILQLLDATVGGALGKRATFDAFLSRT